MSSVLLESKDLRKHFTQGGETLDVLKGITLSLEKGNFVALLGASGSGKSTLLHCLGLLEHWDSGEILFEGESLGPLSDEAKSRFRLEKMGFVFQFHHLIPELSAEENVSLPASIMGEERGARARELLDWMGLSHKLKSFPWQLSGGEQQRVALARSLINNPRLLLTDEVTGNLDRERSLDIMGVLKKVNTEMGTTILSVTHDEELAKLYKESWRLKSGQLDP